MVHWACFAGGAIGGILAALLGYWAGWRQRARLEHVRAAEREAIRLRYYLN